MLPFVGESIPPIKFNNVEVNNVFGDVADDVMDKCKGILEE